MQQYIQPRELPVARAEADTGTRLAALEAERLDPWTDHPVFATVRLRLECPVLIGQAELCESCSLA